MRYMLLIYDQEEQAARTAAAAFPHWVEYAESLKQAGKMLGGEVLKPTTTATTVHSDGKELLTTDGPFAETKEQLGGFFLIEARDLNEAIEWAGKMPHVGRGRVEVRPVKELD
jgi:hypothetical protein